MVCVRPSYIVKNIVYCILYMLLDSQKAGYIHINIEIYICVYTYNISLG